MSDGRGPRMFFEPRGSYAASWACRWRRVKCALGFHGWMMGPVTIEGKWKSEDGTVQPMPTSFRPYVCAFGWPWCRATKRVPR